MDDTKQPPTDNTKQALKQKSPASGKGKAVTISKEKKIENNNKATSNNEEKKLSNNNGVVSNKKEVGHSEVENKKKVDGKNKHSINKKEVLVSKKEKKSDNNRAAIKKKEVGHREDGSNKEERGVSKNVASDEKEVSLSGVESNKEKKVDKNNRATIIKKEVGHNDDGGNKEDGDISKNVASNKKEASPIVVQSNKEKKLYNNNMPRKWQDENQNRGIGYSRGGGYSRGRTYFGNNRGRSNWGRGWGHAGYNNSFHQKRMINTGPSSAYQDHDQSFSKPQHSSPPVHSKTFSYASSPFHPEFHPPFFTNGPVQDCFNPQVIQDDCQYFPQFWEPGQQLGQMPDYQGGFYIPHIFQSSSDAGAPSQITRFVEDAQHDLSSAMAGLKLENSNNLESEKENDMSKKPTSSTDQSKTSKEQQTDDENSRMLYQNNDKQIIASYVTNPLCNLGISVEHDRQLVESFCGVEMRPSSPFPPNFTLQQFYVPYGAPLPQYVIPVMVIPIRNQSGDAGNNKTDDKKDEHDIDASFPVNTDKSAENLAGNGYGAYN